MSKKIQRNYLEIHSINDLNASQKTFKDYSVELVKPDDFHLNKFFIKMLVRDIIGLIDLYGLMNNGLTTFQTKKLKLIF